MFEEHFDVPKTRSEKHQRNRNGGPNGIRTRVSALRGPCPRPLDDGAGQTRDVAGGGGLEPPLPGPEPGVLPLDDPPGSSQRRTIRTRGYRSVNARTSKALSARRSSARGWRETSARVRLGS